jgi:SAM-dependent methyltransferase
VNAKAGYVEAYRDYEWESAFDVATLWATIEHLPNPLATLRAVYGLLKPGGHLFLDTGLGDVLWERFLSGHSQWFDAPQHLFVFSERGLVALLEEAGFAVKEIDTNWERNLLRKYIKGLRHSWICMGTFLATRAFLGKRSFLKTKEEAKWPIGRLVSVVAVKE